MLRLIIKDGKVNRQAMATTRMSSDDLDQVLRSKGMKEAGQVDEARLERSGSLSVIKKLPAVRPGHCDPD